MQRTFLTNLTLLLVLNLLVKPFYLLGIDAGVQQAVGSEVYGGYAALLSLSFLLNIALDLGITNYNSRNIAQHGHLMAKYLGGIAGLRVLLMGFYALLTMGAALLLGYRGEQLGMLGWLVLNQGLAASILYLRSNIAGAQRFRQDSLLSVLDRALLIGAVGWLLWGRGTGAPFQIAWFVWAQTAAYVVTLLVGVVMVLRLSGRVRPQWRAAFGIMVVRQSLPYALLVLLMTFYYRTDSIMLERLLPDGALQAGIYAQGFRFFEAFNMLGFLIAGLLLPMFSRMLGQGLTTSPLALLAFRLVLVSTLAVAIFCSVHAGELMALRYDTHTAQSAPAFAVLMWCFVAVVTTYVFGTLLTAGGELRELNRMAAIGAVANIGLNLLLIPRWQAEGAAWASLFTQACMAVVQLVLARRRFQLQAIGSVLLRGLGYAAGGLGLLFVLEGIGAGLGWAAIAFIVFMPLWAMATGALRPKHLREWPAVSVARSGTAP